MASRTLRLVLLVSGLSLGALPVHAQNHRPADDLLRHIAAQMEAQRAELERQADELARQRQLIESQAREIETLRARTASVAPQPQPGQPHPRPSAAASVQRRESAAGPSAAPPEQPVARAVAAAAERRDDSRVFETDPGLARTGGVLTPAGQLIVDPSVEYSYASQNRALVTGFTIIPGITFGQIEIREIERRTATAALTFRLGLTDRLETNLRIPFLHRTDTVRTQPSDISAQPITVGLDGTNLGDIEFGASYQLNAGQAGWPVMVANLRVKSGTGRNPFEVPIFTSQDGAVGEFLRGYEKSLSTGSGFWSIEPGLTVVYPTDPGVLFASLRYIWNIERTVPLPSESGGAPTPAKLNPGDGVGLNVGLGFALNEDVSFSIGYEHVHARLSEADNIKIAGSRYDTGTFNFGISYRLTNTESINVGLGIGATTSSPDVRLLVRIPFGFTLW